MTKQTVITVGFNKRQIEILEGLDQVYGETLDERVRNIVVMWMHVEGLGEEATHG
jgi:hypothetical protein